MRRLLCALALALAASPAAAQGVEDQPEASVGSLASGLIGDADAEGVFEVVPAEHMIAVRHLRSGLVCRIDPRHGARLIIYPQAARGEDVGCEETVAGGPVIKFTATRYSLATTLEQQIAGAAAALQQHFPGAQSFQLALRASSDALPPSRTAHFIVHGQDGAQEYARVTVAMVDGWVIKLRYTAPAASDVAAQRAALAADGVWAATLAEMRR